MKFDKKKRKTFVTIMINILLVLTIGGCSSGNNTQTTNNSQVVENTDVASTVDSEDKEKDYEEPASTESIEKDYEEPVSTEATENAHEESTNSETTIPVISEESNTSSTEIETTTEQVANEDSVTENKSEETVPVNSEVQEEGESSEIYEEEKNDGLTPTMRNSINMLNYMTSLTRRINEEKGNQLFLETAYNSFDNLFPNSVDIKTQAQITSLMDTIQGYRMISVKRARLQYIYEQNRAQALRQAIPNPIGLLSAVQSGSMLKVAVSVLYMAVDSATSYQAATSQADLQFIKDGWELDDAEANELHESTKNALNYMYDMVRDYDIPGDYALNKGAVDDFVLWSGKPNSQLIRKISWLETNQSTYLHFGPYWIELAKDYYNYGDYVKCLEAVKRYEAISTRIFRKNIDYATILPMAIISAKETMDKDNYVKSAAEYCALILKNTEDKDWELRYFVAQIYMDLYALTNDDFYVKEAYKIARENVNILVDDQKGLNAAYLEDIKEAKAGKDATKREKAEVKKYNKLIKDERKIAVPPVSEALYLNVDLLFALAKERNIDESEQRKIDAILHENGERIFLTKALDDRFWFEKKPEIIDIDTIEVSFDGDSLTIPALYVTERSTIVATIIGANGTTTLDDWKVSEVKRPKGAKDCSDFLVTYESETGDQYKYSNGEAVNITVIPVEEAAEEHVDFTYNVVVNKNMIGLKKTEFERATK